MIDTTQGFTLVREFDATPAELWRAWTDPDSVAAWLHPVGVHTPRESVSFDVRVGGRYAYTMVNDASGDQYPTGGVYREVVPNERLVFTWGVPDDEEAPVITVTIQPLGELTRLTLELQGLAGAPGDGSYHDGWDSALDVLAGYAGQTPVAG